MNKKIYNLMDWAAIEEIVYAEATHPENQLGAHTVGNNTLVQAFFPDSKSVSIYIDGADSKRGKTVKEEIAMELQDEAGYYAALLKGKNRRDYSYYVTYIDKKRKPRIVKEVYADYQVLTNDDIDKIMSGSCMDVQERLGAKKMTLNGVRGTGFAVYAPNSHRVSVVGDFNNWDGRTHQMIRDDVTGIYTLFVPGLEAGEKYKYEILIKGGEKLLRVDPYSKEAEVNGDASIVSSPLTYKWTDAKYIDNRDKLGSVPARMNIYEICASTLAEQGNYKAITSHVLNHVKAFGYNYVEIMPVMESRNDILGFKPSSLFAPGNRNGSYKDICYFVDTMHANGIGVIMQMPCNIFDESQSGIGYYDGSCLYEHEDPRKGIDPRTGAKMYQFGNPLVDQYVLAASLYWVENLHLDGVKMVDLGSMLYLDYYRDEWTPNMYGSNENLEAINFIKRFNKAIHKKYAGVLTIAEDSELWPYVSYTPDMSEADKEQCLGFDYVVGKGFTTDVLSYMETDPIMRAGKHDELTVSTIYQYRERYILAVSHSDVDFGKGGLVSRMPGEIGDKYANLRAFYGYMMTHPGNKQIFMGQDVGDSAGFDGITVLDSCTTDDERRFSEYMKGLMTFCAEHDEMYSLDYSDQGFEWINNSNANDNIIAFKRKNTKGDYLIVVINFANRAYAKYQLGVPAFGKYKQVFTSDARFYGGTGMTNVKVTASKEAKCDGQDYSVLLKIAPLSFNVYAYEAYTKEELDEMEQKRREKEEAIAEKKRVSELLAKEKAKIRASLKEELERKMREAEEAIAGGSEYKSSVSSKVNKEVKDVKKEAVETERKGKISLIKKLKKSDK